MKQSFSTSEVARYCHVTADTIRKWSEARRIHVFKTPGGHRRIPREALLRFLRENGIPIHPDLSTPGVKVLLVDNDNSVVSMVSKSLERAQTDCQVEIVKDSYEAGRLMATYRPDVVFLDLRLPGMDGCELCRRIKEAPDSTGTYVIAIAAPDDTSASARATDAGADACLQKPFTPDDLRRVLAKAGLEIS